MERKFKFTKADTAAVKGIAIIFLILYHGFSIKSRLYGYPVSFWPLSEAKAMAVCRVMVQCVGIFALQNGGIRENNGIPGKTPKP